MGKLKAIGSSLTKLQPTVSFLAPPERRSEAERQLFAPWRAWYNTTRWRRLRLLILKRDRFTCQWPGCGWMSADTSQLVADHREPHRGNEALFWDEDNLQTLCKPCHDGPKQRAENADR